MYRTKRISETDKKVLHLWASKYDQRIKPYDGNWSNLPNIHVGDRNQKLLPFISVIKRYFWKCIDNQSAAHQRSTHSSLPTVEYSEAAFKYFLDSLLQGPAIRMTPVQSNDIYQRYTYIKNHWPSSGIAVLNKKGDKILLVLEKSGKNPTWGFPKGKPEYPESLALAAIREGKEETGLQLDRHLNYNNYIEMIVGSVPDHWNKIEGVHSEYERARREKIDYMLPGRMRLFRLFIVEGVEESTIEEVAKAQVTNTEIEEVKWILLKDLEESMDVDWTKENPPYNVSRYVFTPLFKSLIKRMDWSQ